MTKQPKKTGTRSAKIIRLPDAWRNSGSTPPREQSIKTVDGPVDIRLVEWYDDHYYKVTDHNGREHFLVSTTTVLNVSPKPGLERWRGDVGNREADRISQEAKDRGSRVHHGCFAITNGGAVAYQAPWNKAETISTEDVERLRKKYGSRLVVLSSQHEAVMVWRFSRVLEALGAVIIGSEVKVGSIAQGVAGSIDDIVHIKAGNYDVNGSKGLRVPESGEWLIDIKTGNEYDEHPIQAAEYVWLHQSMVGTSRTLKGAIIVYLDAKTEQGIPGVSCQLFTAKELFEKYIPVFESLFRTWRWKHPTMSPEIFVFPNVIKPYMLPQPPRKKKVGKKTAVLVPARRRSAGVKKARRKVGSQIAGKEAQ